MHTGVWPCCGKPEMKHDQIGVELLSRLQKAVNKEHHAILYCEKLAELAPREDFRSRILNIRDDERLHFRRLSRIYATLTNGHKPWLTDAELPSAFGPGLETAIKNELEAAEFYQLTAEFAGDHYTVRILMNTSHDHMRHAFWFQYMLSRLKN